MSARDVVERSRRSFLSTGSGLFASALMSGAVVLTAAAGCAPLEPPPPRVVSGELRVLVVVTSAHRLPNGDLGGYYLPELLDFYEVVNDAGIPIDIASPKGGEAPMYQRGQYVAGRKNYHFLTETGLLRDLDDTIPLSEVDPARYAAVYFVGGFAAMMDFPTDPNVASVGSSIYENGGVVAAVCHGPSALLNIRLSSGDYLVAGKKLTARAAEEEGPAPTHVPFLLEDALRERGAVYTKADASHVVQDGRLVTGQGVSATRAMARVLVDELVRHQGSVAEGSPTRK